MSADFLVLTKIRSKISLPTAVRSNSPFRSGQQHSPRRGRDDETFANCSNGVLAATGTSVRTRTHSPSCDVHCQGAKQGNVQVPRAGSVAHQTPVSSHESDAPVECIFPVINDLATHLSHRSARYSTFAPHELGRISVIGPDRQRSGYSSH